MLKDFTKTGDNMLNNAEIAKNAIDDFKKIQDYMAVAKEENATRTYAKLKDGHVLRDALGAWRAYLPDSS